MNLSKYILFILFVTSCSFFKPKIENQDIANVINLIQTNPESWRTIVTDNSISELSDFFKNPDNIKFIIEFYEHIKISKFEVVNIKNRFTGDGNEKLCDIVLAREGSEFNITFNFKYFENEKKWKLINLQSKSLLMNKSK